MTPLRLSDLLFTVDAVLDDAFGGRTFWVLAETSDIKNYPDRRYCFMTLVEREGGETLAKAEACLWRKNYPILQAFEAATNVAFARNLKVLVQVGVTYSPVWGLRLEVLQLDHAFTLGNLAQERQATLDALVRDHPAHVWVEDGHYVTSNHLLERPAVWQRLALIGAPNSDGWRDFRHELAHNAHGYTYQIDEYSALVQGSGAAAAICAQLERIGERPDRYDAVVLVRGGGSQLDLSAFDTYQLSLAVAQAGVLVLAGLGHERNVSLTDLLCHHSLKTPTKVAAFLVDHNRQFEESCLRLVGQLTGTVRQTLTDAREALLREADRLRYVPQHYLRARRADLATRATTLQLVDPTRVLARGYALVRQNGRLITRATDVAPGQPLEIQFADGTVEVVRG